MLQPEADIESPNPVSNNGNATQHNESTHDRNIDFSGLKETVQTICMLTVLGTSIGTGFGWFFGSAAGSYSSECKNKPNDTARNHCAALSSEEAGAGAFYGALAGCIATGSCLLYSCIANLCTQPSEEQDLNRSASNEENSEGNTHTSSTP